MHMRSLSCILIAVAAGCGGAAKPTTKPEPKPPISSTTPADGDGHAPATAWKNTTPAAPGVDADAFHALATSLGLDGPGAPASVDPAATARFVALVAKLDDNGGSAKNAVRMYRVTGGTLTVEGEADLGLPQDTYVRDWEWPDASALVILVSDGTLLKFDGKAVTKIARPAKKFFKTKKSGDGPVDRDERLIVTATGELWLDHCGYAYQGDDDPCSSNVYVRIVPAPAKATTTEPTARPAPAKLAVPSDWSFSIQPPPVATSDGPAEPNPYGQLTCAGPGGAHATLPIADGSAGFSIEDAEVVSTQPMIQVVNDWYAGEADMMPMGHLLAGCTVLSEIEYPTVERSASGYWTVAQTRFDAPGGDVILAWQGRIVTELADVSSVTFAP